MLDADGVKSFTWPDRSPDLNVIENVWSLMSRLIYEDGPVASRHDLWTSIDQTVSRINLEFRTELQHFRDSINRRLLECVEKEGGLTHY